MNGRALKMFLALFLCVGGLILPLTLKKSVRAVNNTYFNEPLTVNIYNQTASRLQGTSGTYTILVNGYGDQLWFYIPSVLETTGQYLNCKFQCTGTYTFQLMFYFNNNTSMSGAPVVIVAFSSISDYNKYYLQCTGITAPGDSRVQGVLNDVRRELETGKLEIKYRTQGMGDYIDQDGGTYSIMRNCFTFGSEYQQGIDEVLNDPIRYDLYTYTQYSNAEYSGYIRGKNEILNNPHDFNLFDSDELETAYDSGLADGYDDGYITGYNLGIQAENQEAFTFTGILTNVFATAKSFLNTEIIGKLKLIHFIAIPLMLGIFAIVLKVLRG